MSERPAVHATWSAIRNLALCVLLATTVFVAVPKSAQADAPASTLCHGYAACSRGVFTTHGYQLHQGTSYWRMFAGSNCANYVSFVESTVYGVATPAYLLGNAGQWTTSAALHGALVNNTPTVGSVAEWNGGSPGIPSPGHVAIVEAVGTGQSYIVISQQNILDVDGYNWVRINSDGSGNEWEQWPSHFIHFTSSPKTLSASATPSVAKVIVRVTPASFGSDKFEFNDGVAHVVVPGLTTGLKVGTHPTDYDVDFRSASLRGRYVLHVTVGGSNVQVLHPGGPSTTSKPRIRISGTENLHGPSVVTIDIRPGGPRQATTAPSSPTSTLPVTSAIATSTTP
jgi:surface antigen